MIYIYIKLNFYFIERLIFLFVNLFLTFKKEAIFVFRHVFQKSFYCNNKQSNKIHQQERPEDWKIEYVTRRAEKSDINSNSQILPFKYELKGFLSISKSFYLPIFEFTNVSNQWFKLLRTFTIFY